MPCGKTVTPPAMLTKTQKKKQQKQQKREKHDKLLSATAGCVSQLPHVQAELDTPKDSEHPMGDPKQTRKTRSPSPMRHGGIQSEPFGLARHHHD